MRPAESRRFSTVIFAASSKYEVLNKDSAHHRSSAMEEESIIKPIQPTIFVVLQLFRIFVFKLSFLEAIDGR